LLPFRRGLDGSAVLDFAECSRTFNSITKINCAPNLHR
jgi:hypothetical protein